MMTLPPSVRVYVAAQPTDLRKSFEWATDVIRRLQDGWPLARLDELLPDAWARSKAVARATPSSDAN